jgi:hypothetical protein
MMQMTKGQHRVCTTVGWAGETKNAWMKEGSIKDLRYLAKLAAVVLLKASRTNQIEYIPKPSSSWTVAWWGDSVGRCLV